MLHLAPYDDQTLNAVFDLTFDTSTDVATQDAQAAATLIYAALYTDQKAPAARVPQTTAQRGWWARPEAGSGLWHVRRQALTSSAKAEALETVQGALSRYQDELGAKGLTDLKAAERSSAGALAGNVSLLFITVTGKHNGRSFSIDLSL